MASVPSPVTFVGKRTSWISKEVIVTSDMVVKMECSDGEDRTLSVSPCRPYKHVAAAASGLNEIAGKRPTRDLVRQRFSRSLRPFACGSSGPGCRRLSCGSEKRQCGDVSFFSTFQRQRIVWLLWPIATTYLGMLLHDRMTGLKGQISI